MLDSRGGRLWQRYPGVATEAPVPAHAARIPRQDLVVWAKVRHLGADHLVAAKAADHELPVDRVPAAFRRCAGRAVHAAKVPGYAAPTPRPGTPSPSRRRPGSPMRHTE